MKHIVFILILIFLTRLTFAQDVIECNSMGEYYSFDTTKVTTYLNKYGECSFNVNSAKLYESYRSYALSTTGHFFIFNVFDLYSAPSESTGARSFYLLPILSNKLTLTYDAKNFEIKITTPSGLVVTFDSIHSEIKDIQNIEWSEDPNISKFNKGGVELSAVNETGYYILDFDWRQGSDPRALLTRDALVHSSDSTCTVQKKSLLQPIYDSQNRVDSFRLRYQSESEIQGFIKANCR